MGITWEVIKMTFTDLSGRKFERLYVVRKSFTNKHRKVVWECLCDCGKTAYVATRELKSGNTKSCGCLKRERIINQSQKGFFQKNNKAEYSSYASMKDRCYNSNCPHYDRYGGRGIRVCERWLGSFENFLIDIGRAPSKLHSIDSWQSLERNYGNPADDA